MVSNDAESPPWLKLNWYGSLSGKGRFGRRCCLELLFEVKLLYVNNKGQQGANIKFCLMRWIISVATWKKKIKIKIKRDNLI